MSFGSNVSPSMVGSRVVGSVVPFIFRLSVVEYSAGSGVNSVVVVLVGLSFNSFSIVQLWICSRYGWTFCCAMLWFLSVDSMVMSSAYVISLHVGVGGSGMSEEYRLKSVGESTPPCGTPDLNCCVLDLVLLYVVYACLPFM